MTFRITFDYRFDTTGFFDDPGRRAALEAAAALWEAVIDDEFDDVPAGTVFDVIDPATLAGDRTVVLDTPIDDVRIFVGALPLEPLARAGSTGFSASGDVYRARITDDFRGQGPVTDFEPWAGTIAFDSGNDWSFDLAGPVAGKSDFLTTAAHEIGHVLGIGRSSAFVALVQDGAFTGPNAMALNGGRPVPLTADTYHVADGFADDTVLLDPTSTRGARTGLSDIDKAILADIGYEVDGFTRQGRQPEIATPQGETIFGTDLADAIDGLGGDDEIAGGAGDDTLAGGAGADSLFGQAGDDRLAGGPGHDRLYGRAGADLLIGGPGDDTIFGGDDAAGDVTVFGPGQGRDRIAEFDLGADRLRIVSDEIGRAEDLLGLISKPFGNVSRLAFGDGSHIDVFHDSQPGTPLEARHLELVRTDGNAPPRGTVRIEGTPEEDATLIADASGLTDPDGRGPLSHVWLRDGVPIAGATAPAYTLVQADVGARIAVDLSWIDGAGRAEAARSAATAPVAGVNDAPTGVPTISGRPEQGATLTADASALADEDGRGALSYTWLRAGTPIPGATGPAYTLRQADAGAPVAVRVSYVDGGGTAEAVESAPTAPVVDVNDPPTGTVTLAGRAALGEVLRADASALDDPDGMGPLSYTWLRDGVAIAGATGPAYTLAQADVGARIAVEATYTDGGGRAETVAAAATAPVADIGRRIEGTGGSDDLAGTIGADTISGGGADDRLTGGAGDDALDGGPGEDSAAYSGARAAYTVTLSPGGISVTDRRAEGDGTDALSGIERLDFADGAWPLAIFSDVAGLPEAAFRDFLEMYVAYFDRAADAEGLFFWGTAFARGFGLDEAAAEFLKQPEYSAMYDAGASDADFARAVYDNVLGRQPDPAGFAFWVDTLASGSVTRDVFILEVLRGAKAPPPVEADPAFRAQKEADIAWLAGKTDIGIYYAVTRGLSDVGDARDVMALYDGTEAGLQAARAATDAAHAAALDPETGAFLLPLVGVVDDPFAAL